MSGGDPVETTVDSNSVDSEDVDTTVDGSDSSETVDAEVRRVFWRLVGLGNLALFGITVGPMVIYFEGDLALGSGLTVVGIVAGGYGLVRYRQYRRDRLLEAGE